MIDEPAEAHVQIRRLLLLDGSRRWHRGESFRGHCDQFLVQKPRVSVPFLWWLLAQVFWFACNDLDQKGRFFPSDGPEITN